MNRRSYVVALVVTGALVGACSGKESPSGVPAPRENAPSGNQSEPDGDDWPPRKQAQEGDASAGDAGAPQEHDAAAPKPPADPPADPQADLRTAIVYTAPLSVGIDHDVDIIPTFGADHALTAYQGRSAKESPALGTLRVEPGMWQEAASSAGSEFLAIGRWSSGTSSAGFYGEQLTLSSTQGFHYAVGTLAQDLPASGDATYAAGMGGATNPLRDDGSIFMGYVEGLPKATVRYGAVAKIALSFSMIAGQDQYTLATTGGLADPSQSEIMTYSSAAEKMVVGGIVPVTGSGCPAGCTAVVRGFFTGAHGSNLAMAYAIDSGSPSAVRGVLVLAH